MRRDDAARPWYREPWPWILMAGPAAVVVAGFVTLWLAIDSQDGLVADDYYKQGLAVNQVIDRAQRAMVLGMHAEVSLSSERIELELASSAGAALPARVYCRLVHPTRKGLDQVLVLAPGASSGRYATAIAPLATGKWQVTLEDEARTWRLAGELRVPDQSLLRLGPPRGAAQ